MRWRDNFGALDLLMYGCMAHRTIRMQYPHCVWCWFLSLFFQRKVQGSSGISRERSPGQGLGDLPAEWQEHRDDPGPGGLGCGVGWGCNCFPGFSCGFFWGYHRKGFSCNC